MTRAVLLGLVVVAMGACSPEAPPREAQYVLTVTTDAPLPFGPDEVHSPREREPLFDRVNVEVHALGDDPPCVTDCDHDDPVDQPSMQRGEVSFGVRADRPSEVRVQLYLNRYAFPGVPGAQASIDAWIALPALPAGVLERRTVVLEMRNVGVVADRGGAQLPSAEPADPKLPGSWPGARVEGCTSPSGPGQLCIEGGASYRGSFNFFLGRPFGVLVMSPFWLDAREVTVGDLRASGLARVDATPGKASNPSDDPTFGCTYTLSPGANEELPVTCISWSLAQAYCERGGGSLPTEAQFERAASGRRAKHYVWGDDLPTCDDAVWGRDFASILSEGLADELRSPACILPGAPSGPRKAGSGLRDRLRVDGGELLDLAGNVREWAADLYNDDWWDGASLRVDPRCDVPTPGATFEARSIRGGSYRSSQRPMLAAYFDHANAERQLGGDVGFRCARPGR